MSWWPLAPGWWILAAAILVCVIAGVYFIWRKRRDNRYRRLALAELDQLYLAFQQHQDSLKFLQQLSQLLRRAALVAFPRDQVAALNGEDWVKFLADSANMPVFSDQYKQLLSCGLYQPHPSYESEQLRDHCRQWIGKHKRSLLLKQRRLNTRSVSSKPEEATHA